MADKDFLVVIDGIRFKVSAYNPRSVDTKVKTLLEKRVAAGLYVPDVPIEEIKKEIDRQGIIFTMNATMKTDVKRLLPISMEEEQDVVFTFFTKEYKARKKLEEKEKAKEEAYKKERKIYKESLKKEKDKSDTNKNNNTQNTRVIKGVQ